MSRQIGKTTRARRAGGAFTYSMSHPTVHSGVELPKRTKFVYLSNNTTRKRNSRGVEISRLTRNPLKHTGKRKPILDTGVFDEMCNRETVSTEIELKPVVKPRSFLNWLFVDSDEEEDEVDSDDEVDIVEMDIA
jgi:hypothetical protein